AINTRVMMVVGTNTAALRIDRFMPNDHDNDVLLVFEEDGQMFKINVAVRESRKQVNALVASFNPDEQATPYHERSYRRLSCFQNVDEYSEDTIKRCGYPVLYFVIEDKALEDKESLKYYINNISATGLSLIVNQFDYVVDDIISIRLNVDADQDAIVLPSRVVRIFRYPDGKLHVAFKFEIFDDIKESLIEVIRMKAKKNDPESVI
ncbi:MAG: PilZ domain-containing protein, partial [Candidatus Gracilibacteria bacterium]|nr:PilZ domain-containing protein [Candidatus Gracilibacteria bacterium]